MAEQKTITESDWLETEIKELENKPQGIGNYERLPSPKFEEGKMQTIVIDASKPFQKWTEVRDGKEKVKSIIPCVHNGIKCNWWLANKNPIYRQVIQECSDALKKDNVKIRLVQTGTKELTRYTLVKE